MAAQVLPHRSTPVHDAQDVRIDQGCQSALPVRHEVVIDGIGLQHDDLALDEELGEHVAGPERGHVAGGEHERRAGVRGGVGIGAGLARHQGLPGDARLHPHLGGRLRERDAVEGAVREDLHPQTAARRLAHRAGEGGLAVLRDVAQRVAQQTRQAYERADASEELLAGFGRARCKSLGRARRCQPVLCGRHGVGNHLRKQVGACRGAGLGPRGGVTGDLVDDRIERSRVNRGDRRPRPAACGVSGPISGRPHRPPARDGHVVLPSASLDAGPAVSGLRANLPKRTDEEPNSDRCTQMRAGPGLPRGRDRQRHWPPGRVSTPPVDAPSIPACFHGTGPCDGCARPSTSDD